MGWAGTSGRSPPAVLRTARIHLHAHQHRHGPGLPAPRCAMPDMTTPVGCSGPQESVQHQGQKEQFMPIQGVLFDMDDTLFDYSASKEAGVLAQLQAEGLLDRFPDSATAVALWRNIMERQYARFLNGELTFPEQQRERAREFLSHLGRTHAPQSVGPGSHCLVRRIRSPPPRRLGRLPRRRAGPQETRTRLPPRHRLQLIRRPSASQARRHRPPALLPRHTGVLCPARRGQACVEYLPRGLRFPGTSAAGSGLHRRQVRSRRRGGPRSRAARLLARPREHRRGHGPRQRHPGHPLPR